MQTVSPSIEVVFHLPEGYTDPEKFIEAVGRICYKSEDRITDDSAPRFVKMLKDRGHTAMLEHCVATAFVVCDRGHSHEQMRHRLCSYAMESTRYCDYSKKPKEGEPVGKGVAVIKPMGMLRYPDDKGSCLLGFTEQTDFLPVQRWALEKVVELLDCQEAGHARRIIANMLNAEVDETQLWELAMKWSDQSYRMMRRTGSPPQRARHVLPIGLKTEYAITANMTEWLHIFKMRCSKEAHPHIRTLMLQALKVFAKRVPSIFGDMWKELSDG